MRLFYSELESKLKRFQPIDYARFASRLMRRGLTDPKMGVSYPPFKILHSMEANCAYARGQNRDPVDTYRLNGVMNVWHGNPNPLYEGAMEKNVQHFFLLMHREQIELQYRHSNEQTARIQRLFVTDEPMPALSREFYDAYGLGIENWIQLSWLTYAACNQREDGWFRKSALMAYEGIDVRTHVVHLYFSLASRTPADIGRRFREEVLAMTPELRFLIRSVFLETPIIDFGGDDALAPHPQLVLRDSGHGLYRLIKQLPSFDKDFGPSVQAYVRDILMCIHGTLSFLEDNQLESLAGEGKSCDFLVELADCIVLVECKGTTFVATGLLEEVILNDGSTGKIAKAISQLYSTARDIELGVFAALGIPENKPVVGIVATFGEIPLANNDWYFESFVLRRAAKELRPPIYPSKTMARRPVILSLQTLQDLVVLLNATNISPLALYDEKQELPYIGVGDWEPYLGTKLQELDDTPQPLPFVEKEVDRLVEQMEGGQPPDRVDR